LLPAGATVAGRDSHPLRNGAFTAHHHGLLVDRFGRAVVKRGNRAFNIRENTYRVEADVVPLFEFRQYW